MSISQDPIKDRRRSVNDPLMSMFRQIQNNQQEIKDSQRAMDNKLTKHMESVPKDLAEAIAELMADSFPQGDPAGHRRYHEASIKAAEDRADFWSKMRMELFKWGLLGFAGWAAYALWHAFLQGPSK